MCTCVYRAIGYLYLKKKIENYLDVNYYLSPDYNFTSLCTHAYYVKWQRHLWLSINN